MSAVTTALVYASCLTLEPGRDRVIIVVAIGHTWTQRCSIPTLVKHYSATDFPLDDQYCDLEGWEIRIGSIIVQFVELW